MGYRIYLSPSPPCSATHQSLSCRPQNQEFVDRRLVVGRAGRLLTLPLTANEEHERLVVSYAQRVRHSVRHSHHTRDTMTFLCVSLVIYTDTR